MPWNGSGAVSLTQDFVADAAAGDPSDIIDASKVQTETQNLADAFSNVLTLDGQTKPTSNLDFNSKKITNLATPTSSNDATTKSYVDTAVSGVIPDQTSNSGKYLTTDGSSASWGSPVTSVAMSVPSELSVSGSPITSSGTLAVTWGSASGRKFVASPSNGTSGAYAGRAITAADLPTLTSALMPTGAVVQVVSTTKTDTFSTSSTSFTAVTGLSVSITPKSSSNKVLVFAVVNAGNSSQTATRISRGGSAIGVGDAASSRVQCGAGTYFNNGDANTMRTGMMVYLDSPATTSATTYQVDIMTGGGTCYVNRTANDTDSATTGFRASSSIVVVEVVG